MHITSLELRNFRCFTSLPLEFKSPVVLITGPNGSGKTSILEALHFMCYLRSFKTHIAKELIFNTTEGFSVNLSLASAALDTLTVNLTRTKRTVKLNQKPLQSFKELYMVYKAITITEDDLAIVQGAPQIRRSFIDQMITLQDPSYAILLRKYRQILDNRNALLAQNKYDQESYLLWTTQLLIESRKIQEFRRNTLTSLSTEALLLEKEISHEHYALAIAYQYARPYTNSFSSSTAQELLEQYPTLIDHERSQRRSLFGAHLDDFSLEFGQRYARTYASRGQQKLIVFLLKLAQAKLLEPQLPIFLIDDFMADFDEKRATALLHLINRFSCQLIMTSAFIPPFLEKALSKLNTQYIEVKAQENAHEFINRK